MPEPGMGHVRWDEFDRHAEGRVPAGQRAQLERAGRYALSPLVEGGA